LDYSIRIIAPVPFVKFLDFSTNFPTKLQICALIKVGGKTMLSLNLLEAVLQGLSPVYLHQDYSTEQFCFRIEKAMQNGAPPLEALQLALNQATDPELRIIHYFAAQAEFVSQLTDLSFRQKELLVALRAKGVCSAAELSCILNWERSHTHHRLTALIQKGYAGKFYGEKGPRYFPAKRLLRSSAKIQALQVILEFVAQRTAPSLASKSSPAAPATTVTSATIATNATSATNEPMPIGFNAADALKYGQTNRIPVENSS
jgi:hypothetical protein